MGLKKNEKLGDELQFLSAKIALLRSGGFRDRRLNATNTRKHTTHTHTHTHTHTPPPLAQKNICC